MPSFDFCFSSLLSLPESHQLKRNSDSPEGNTPPPRAERLEITASADSQYPDHLTASANSQSQLASKLRIPGPFCLDSGGLGWSWGLGRRSDTRKTLKSPTETLAKRPWTDLCALQCLLSGVRHIGIKRVANLHCTLFCPHL